MKRPQIVTIVMFIVGKVVRNPCHMVVVNENPCHQVCVK